MNIIHVVRDLDVASGGPSRSVPALAEHQAEIEGSRVSVVFENRGQKQVNTKSARVDYREVNQSSVRPQAIRQLLNNLIDTNNETVIHLHGLWSPAIHHSARFARTHDIPCAISTRGMLANWAINHKAWKKKLAWTLYQKRDLQQADCLVTTSESEYRAVKAAMPGQRIEVIPNGCRVRPKLQSDHLPQPLEPASRWALAMGRLHPVKGYAELISSWARLKPEGWKLAIAGPDEDGYRDSLDTLIRKLNLQGEVKLLGEVDDEQKWALLDQSELFLAPSKTENFGMAIAEALQSGTPVVTTTGTPWQELHEFNCGWWVNPAEDEFDRALMQAFSATPSKLSAMGDRGADLIQTRYSWSSVAQKSLDLYRSLMGYPH